MNNIAVMIDNGECVLGIELGSTRVKSILMAPDSSIVAIGIADWENAYDDGVWTYSLELVWQVIANSYAMLAQDVENEYGIPLKKIRSLGVSAMMHGYLVFDKSGKLLVPFRTWRNTMTQQASQQLTDKFQFPIPQRWSVSHLYQAILNKESHVKDIDFVTTLAGYVHWQLTGEKVIGIGDASGIFPIDTERNDYNERMLQQFDLLVAGLFNQKMRHILPRVLLAGGDAGTLLESSIKLLDKSGNLESGILLCPPEGDAGTGMVATNSITPTTGNVSVGTSVFAMVVLDRPPSKLYSEIDLVTTPTGKPVAMVHCNNGTSDINAWVDLFIQFSDLMGVALDKGEVFSKLYKIALQGGENCGGLLSCNYSSGEHLTGLDEGRPLFIRKSYSHLTLANFMKTHLYASLATLKIGMDILKKDGIEIRSMTAHGGFFKTKDVGQQVMANALGIPIALLPTGAEGGAWGMAILAGYRAYQEKSESLDGYLSRIVFQNKEISKITPTQKEVEEYEEYIKEYFKLLQIEKLSVEVL